MAKFHARYLDERGETVEERQISAVSQSMATQEAIHYAPAGTRRLLLMQEVRVLDMGNGGGG